MWFYCDRQQCNENYNFREHTYFFYILHLYCRISSWKVLLSETDWHHFCGPDGASKCLCAPYRFLLPYSYSYLSLSFFSLCQILCWFQIDSWQLSNSFSDGRAHDECLLDFGSKIFAWNFKLHLNWWLNVRINWWIKNGLFPHKLLHVSFTSKKFSSGLHLLIVSRIPILDQKAFLSSRNQLEHVREYQLLHSF